MGCRLATESDHKEKTHALLHVAILVRGGFCRDRAVWDRTSARTLRWRTACSPSYRASDYLRAPGNYGMSYGFASYGMPQTYTVFSAYPGPSYGSNYPPYGILPGRYGVGLWRPGYVAPGYVYGQSYYYPPSSFSYRTFRLGYNPGVPVNGVAPPPVGVYAPYLGPRSVYGW